MLKKHWNKKTLEYTYSSEATINRNWKEGDEEGRKYVITSNSTLDDLLPVGENEINVRNVVDKVWELKPDFTKETFYNKETQEKAFILEIGIEPGEELTKLVPFENSKWAVDKWVLDENKLKAMKTIEASNMRKEIERTVLITSFEVEDFVLSTDDRGNIKLAGAVIVASKEPESDLVTDWKTESGWRKLKNIDIINMAELAFLNVKNSFKDLERIETEIFESDDIESYVIEFVL